MAITIGQLVFIALLAALISRIITKYYTTKYWRRILNARKTPVVWDAMPNCVCGKVNEALFDLDDNDKWFEVECTQCHRIFWIKPEFKLIYEEAITKEETEE